MLTGSLTERRDDMAGNLVPDTYIKVNGVMVKSYLLTEHNPNRIDMPSKRTKPLAGVTIHNTGAIKVTGTTMAEQYTRATRNGNMNSVRVHYYVDDVEAWQNLPEDYTGWHAADGNGDGNMATIAIECIGKTKAAEDNAARLAAWLLYKNGLGKDNLYTHTYWLNVRDSRGEALTKDARCVLPHPYKVCPIYIIPHWTEFVAKVKKYIGETAKPSKMYYVQVGAFQSRENAEAYLAGVKKDYPGAFIKEM